MLDIWHREMNVISFGSLSPIGGKTQVHRDADGLLGGTTCYCRNAFGARPSSLKTSERKGLLSRILGPHEGGETRRVFEAEQAREKVLQAKRTARAQSTGRSSSA